MYMYIRMYMYICKYHDRLRDSAFLTWCKSKYHASSDQLRKQERCRLAHKGASAAGSTG